ARLVQALGDILVTPRVLGRAGHQHHVGLCVLLGRPAAPEQLQPVHSEPVQALHGRIISEPEILVVMSTENIELIRRLYEWFASGDGEKAFEVYDRGIEWDSSATRWLVEMGFPPLVVGHDAVRTGMASWLEAWQSIEFVPDEL